jgi:uncharacterized protein DUF3800
MTSFNIYCDESCHLENDRQRAMVIGALICPAEKTRSVAESIRQRKRLHGLADGFEVKWTKVSPAKVDFYLSLVDLFFDDPDLRFRAVVVPDKSLLNHTAFDQDHDTFYYKMYFNMLKVVFAPESTYRVYIDMKDTQSAGKERRLLEYLCNQQLDFNRQRIQSLQSVRSHQVEQIQLADLLIGATSYVNRGLESSTAKAAVVARLRQRSGYALTVSTPLSARKVNVLRWNPDSDA